MELPILEQTRPCYGCTVCCTVIGVRELGKPYYAPCEHIASGKCGIYGNHPQSCKDYTCLWAIEMAGEIEDRPDKLGFMFGFAMEFGKSWLDVFQATSDPNEEQQKRLLHLTNLVLERYPEISGVRYHYYNAKVGVGFHIKSPYPEGTFDIGNKYMQDPDQPGLLYHIPSGEIP